MPVSLQIFGDDESGMMVPVLGVSPILVAFLINLSGNRLVQGVASFIGVLKIAGILIFGLVGIWVADSLYRALVGKAEIREAKELVQSLLDMEEHETKRLVRQTERMDGL